MHDTRALVKLIELFNRVHELETELTDEQLRAIHLKTGAWLMYILQISAGNLHKQRHQLQEETVAAKTGGIKIG